MIPSAMYLWSRFSSIASPTGIEKIIVAPAMVPTTIAMIQASIEPSARTSASL